jgi:hypothetical protein
MFERRQLPLPGEILDFDDQLAANQRCGLGMFGDFRPCGQRPRGSRTRFRIGNLGRKLQFGDEAAGAFHRVT